MILRKENGQLKAKAGLGIIDNVLSTLSDHAISNKAVSTEFAKIKDFIDKVKKGEYSMPTLNYTAPLFESSSSSLSYTAIKECYVVGSIQASTQSVTQISINGIVVITLSATSGASKSMPLLKLNAGDTISINRSDVNSKIIVYDTIS